jgi:hypothetical protein
LRRPSARIARGEKSIPSGFEGPVDVVTEVHRNAPTGKTQRKDAAKSVPPDEHSNTEMHFRREHVSNVSRMVQDAMMALVSGDAGTALKLLHDVRQALAGLPQTVRDVRDP